MTVRNAQPMPCWVLKIQPDDELVPHFPTEDLATAHAADGGADDATSIRQAYDNPCVEIVCDDEQCGQALDPSGDDGATHLDPADPLPCPIDDLDWAQRDGRHYCPEHPPDDTNARLHRPSIRHLPAASPQTVMHLTGV